MPNMSVTFNKSTCVESVSVEGLMDLICRGYSYEALASGSIMRRVYEEGLAEAIENGDKELYKKAKSGLPAVLISLNSDKVSNPNVFNVLNQVQIDVDHLSDDTVDEIMGVFKELPFVSLTFITPSMNGVKAIVEYAPSNHEGLFDTFESAKAAHKFAYSKCLEAVKKALPDVTFDESCNNLNRLCYIPFSGSAVTKVATPISIDFSSYKGTEGKNKVTKRNTGIGAVKVSSDWVDSMVGPESDNIEAETILNNSCSRIKNAHLGTIHNVVLKACCKVGYIYKYFKDMRPVVNALSRAFSENKDAGGITMNWERDIQKFVEYGMQSPIILAHTTTLSRYVAPTLFHNVTKSELSTPELVNSNIFPGSTHVVRGEHGVGKTSIIGKHVIELAKTSNFFDASKREITTFITPRISLSESISSKFGIDYYINERKIKSGIRRSMVITTNSITNDLFRESFAGNYNLYIDEISTIRKDIFNKNGTMKKNAGKVFARLVEVMSGANTLVCSDADITDLDLELISSVRSGVIHYHDIKSTREKPIVLVRKVKRTEHWTLVANYLSAGEKVYCTSDNATDLSKMYRMFQKTHPDKKGLLIHSKNVTKEGAEFIKDAADSSKETKLDYDYVLCSPSIESGVSIEYTHFTKMIAVYNGITAPTGFVQQILRVRTAKKIELCIKKTKSGGCAETIAETILNRIIESNYLEDVFSSIFDVPLPDNYTLFAAKNLALENSLLNSPYENLLGILRYRGYQLKNVDTKLKQVEKEVIAQITSEIEADRQTDVLTAIDIDVSRAEGLKEYERLKAKDDLTEKERASIKRVVCKGILGSIPLNEETVALTRNSNLKSQRYAYLAATGDSDSMLRGDFERDSRMPLYLRSDNKVLNYVFNYFNRVLGINIKTGEGSFSSSNVKKASLDLSMAQVIDNLGLNKAVNLTRTYETEMKYTVISRIYKKIGVHFNRTRSNGEDTYSINPEPDLDKYGGVNVAGIDLIRRANGKD